MKIWINRAGQNLGTFSLEELQEGVDRGRFVGSDLAWKEGLETWLPLAQFPDIRLPDTSLPVAPVPSTRPAAPVPAAITPSESEPSAPSWERREMKRVPAFFLTIREAVFEPHLTFPRLQLNGALLRPAIFYAVSSGLVAAVFIALYAFFLIFILAVASSSHAASRDLDIPSIPPWVLYLGIPAGAILLELLVIGFSVAGSFLTSLFHHLILMILGGANRGFEGTHKVVCYSHGGILFSVVPCVGTLAYLVTYYISSIIGLSKVHGCEGWKSAVAMLAPLLLLCGLYVAILAATAALGGMASSSSTHT